MSAKAIISEAVSKKYGTIILLGITILLATVAKIAMAFIVQILIDRILPVAPVDNPPLGMWVGLFVLAMISSLLLDVASQFQAVKLGTFVTSSLSKTIYSQTLRADYSDISKLSIEELALATTKDSETIGNQFIGKNWVVFWKQILVLTILFASMMFIVPLWGLIAFIVLPLFYMSMHSLKKFITKIDQETFEEMNKVKAKATDSYAKIRGLKLVNGIVAEEEHFEEQLNVLMKKHRFLDFIKRLYDNQLTHLFIGVIAAILFGIGGFLSIQNQMQATIGKLIIFVLLIPFVYYSFKTLMNTSIHPRIIEKELKTIETILSIKSEIKSEPISQLDDVISLKFQNVTYYGDATESSLEQISFELKRGEKLGVLSYDRENRRTLFELFTKLIRPRDGVVSINNCDINKLNTFYLRDLITSVSSDLYLFPDTIEKNITYPLAFDEYKYNDALNKSGLKELITKFDLKDQTIVNDSTEFTKSFQQRLRLANAFYKDSKIFVLNDATLHLDVRSEETIMKEINKLKNKIAIIMSDKAYNVLSCDKVMILMNGQMIEYGKLQDLLQNKDSEFNKMIKKVKTTRNVKVS